MNITAANLQEMLNNIVTANEGKAIEAIEAMINELVEIKEIIKTEEAIIKAQNELVEIEKSFYRRYSRRNLRRVCKIPQSRRFSRKTKNL